MTPDRLRYLQDKHVYGKYVTGGREGAIPWEVRTRARPVHDEELRVIGESPIEGYRVTIAVPFESDVIEANGHDPVYYRNVVCDSLAFDDEHVVFGHFCDGTEADAVKLAMAWAKASK